MLEIENNKTYTLDTPEGKAIIERLQEKTNFTEVISLTVVDKTKWYVTYIGEDIEDITDKDIIFKKVHKTLPIYWSQYPSEIEKQKYILTGKCDIIEYDAGGQSYVRKSSN